jgi:hypothetical protein
VQEPYNLEAWNRENEDVGMKWWDWRLEEVREGRVCFGIDIGGYRDMRARHDGATSIAVRAIDVGMPRSIGVGAAMFGIRLPRRCFPGTHAPPHPIEHRAPAYRTCQCRVVGQDKSHRGRARVRSFIVTCTGGHQLEE